MDIKSVLADMKYNKTCPDCVGKGMVMLIGGNKPYGECSTCKGKGNIDVKNDLKYWEKELAKEKDSLFWANHKVNQIKRTMDECKIHIERIKETKNCQNCIQHDHDGTCSRVAGENYGSSSEIGNDFCCDNWKGETDGS